MRAHTFELACIAYASFFVAACHALYPLLAHALA